MEKSHKKQDKENQYIEREVLCVNSAGTHKIVYSDWGHNNKNIIVCIHGLTGNGHDFDYLAPELIKHNYRELPNNIFFNSKITYAYDEKISKIFKKNPIGDQDLWELWKNITCPTLVLRGGKSLILTAQTLEKMKDTAANNFQMGTHIFEDCGHVPSLMAPYQIKVIADWLVKK